MEQEGGRDDRWEEVVKDGTQDGRRGWAVTEGRKKTKKRRRRRRRVRRRNRKRKTEAEKG